jgi:hypothetical protein
MLVENDTQHLAARPAWDGTLLTVGEAQRNLRTEQPLTRPQSRRDDTYNDVPSRAGLGGSSEFVDP